MLKNKKPLSFILFLIIYSLLIISCSKSNSTEDANQEMSSYTLSQDEINRLNLIHNLGAGG